MAEGPGKYDRWAERIAEREQAGLVMVLVLDGRLGTGVSCKVAGKDREDARENHRRLPDVLRALADSMEADLGKPRRN
jgi:hypothetical protein